MNNEFNDPFDFAAFLMEMDLEVLVEIYPETGDILGIFKYYTYQEALDRYLEWKSGK